MSFLFQSTIFLQDYEKLKNVSLDPAKHSAANAYEHCEMVNRRVIELAKMNGCTEEETSLLSDLARVHDIGKITGNSKPEESVKLLPGYGASSAKLVDLVKYHDTNLPWYIAFQRCEPPGDKAWNRLARSVDMRLLCLFMVADRVDCPSGWRANAPLVWFLDEVKRRRLLNRDLVIDDETTRREK